jgi:hypothetical protein
MALMSNFARRVLGMMKIDEFVDFPVISLTS